MALGSTTAAAPVHRRTQGRLKVRLPAKIVTLTRTHAAILENISRKGARLQVDLLPTLGAQAVLRWDRYEAFGTISWASGEHCGVLFASVLAEEPLRATLALDEAAALPDQSDITTEAAREWAAGNRRSGFD